MTQSQYPPGMTQAVLKWRDLAERRRAHFVELYESGRWRLYYSDADFLARMREAVTVAERWAEIAPRAEDRPAA
jgi:uncharacterized repeat protein (TIGR03809 family)